MNEDGTVADTSNTGDESGEQLETTTEAEVLEVLGKSPVETVEENNESTESEEAEQETNEETENTESTEATENSEDDKNATSQNEETEASDTSSAEAPTFTVEIEDANGNKFTVGPDDNLEEVLAEFEPKNNGQVLQLMRDLDRLTGEKSAYEKEQADAAAEAEHAQHVASIQEGWDKEVLKLQGEKRLPLDAKIEDRKQEVFKFMADENEKRQADGRPLLQSFEDALDKLELKEGKDAKAQAAKDEKERNKQRGAMVGGSSAPATSGTPAYKSGTAHNATEALRGMGLL